MTILRSGSTEKYSANFSKAFGGSARPAKADGKKTAAKVAVKTAKTKAKPKSSKKK